MAKPNLRLPFLKKYHDRHGKLRFYHRPTGTPLLGKPGSPEFMTAYHTACGHVAPTLTLVKQTPRLRTDAEGSIDWLVTNYFNSDQWKRLSKDTQAGDAGRWSVSAPITATSRSTAYRQSTSRRW